MIEITIPGPPLPWKAPYKGTRGCFSPRYNVMIDFREIVSKQYSGELLDERIIVDLIFLMPIPKSTSNKKRAMMLSGEISPESTPDRTNCAKLYEDVLQGIVYKNDSKIVDGRTVKIYDENPRTVIRIEKIGRYHDPKIW